jgi:hypothetical protein
MTRSYATKVTTAQLAVGVLVGSLAVAGIVRLSQWLSVPAELVEPLPAPAEQVPASPGALVCPDPPEAAPGQHVAASDLIDCPDTFDGRSVTYRGEAIRAVVLRGDHAIVQVNDDPYADGPIPERRTHLGGNSGITVIMPAAASRQIEVLGSYRAQGDLLSVSGVFQRASDLSAGEPAIHAVQVDIVRDGYLIEHPVSPRRAVTAAGLVVLLAALLVATRRAGAARGRSGS